MQRLFEFLKKLNTPLVYSALLILFGALFIFLPSEVLDILILTLGVLMILLALVRLTVTVSNSRGGTLSVELITDILIGIGGIALTAMQSSVAHLICRVLGVAIAIYALVKLIRHSKPEQKRDKRFWLGASVYIALVTAGLWLGFFPLWPQIMTGIALLVLAGKFIYDEVEKRRDARGKTENGTYYTDDFEDKTEH